jgi:hypothetical protein
MHEASNRQLLVRAQMEVEREIILPFCFCFSSRRPGAPLFLRRTARFLTLSLP